MRLSQAKAADLPDAIERPGYDRAAQARGIVHLGIGAFHRAHQAVYADDAMNAGDNGWGITGVSLRSPAIRDALAPQDGLYTVTQRGSDGQATRLIGSIAEVLVAPNAPDAVVAAIASPDTRLVTLTVTEKGYHRLPGGALDIASVDRAGTTIYHLLASAFAARRAAGTPGLTILCCDNINGNGAAIARSMREYLDRVAPDLVGWFDAECACPSSMVDRIVPATTPDDLAGVAAAIGMDDEGAVVTESFRQWVIEDRFAGARPRFDAGGAQFVTDVEPYETAKLRMLNGAHSALAYLGLAAGHTYVHQAIADPSLRPIVETLMRGEAAGSFDAAADQDLTDYADRLIARFDNRALQHALAQIAQDGSQKISQRWLASLGDNAARGRTCPATLTALGGWLRHLRGDNGAVIDPMGAELAALWRQAGRDRIVEALFGDGGLFASDWHPTADDRAALEATLVND